MTTALDDLLVQSLLLRAPRVPSDVVPYEEEYDAEVRAAESPGDRRAARALDTLCEAALLHCTLDRLTDFVTDQLPEPPVAWTLGCALHLAGLESGARFWWQYAAGAGDPAAAHSLHLHHLAHGDPHAAAFWRAQACDDEGGDLPAADTDTATVLRVLSSLTEQAPPRPHTPVAVAVIDFVRRAVAIGYDRHPGFEIPLPGPDFAVHLEIIAAATSAPRRPVNRRRPLPNRPTAGTRPTAHPTLERLVVEVTSEDGASAFKALKEVVAGCWPGRFRVKTDESGTNPRYYLVR
ncbi:hypothetical protein ABZX85_14570 [Streptomyces sp. NPDC004539]|uniref:hypothetical protein n=1 Tax=Streptomyces sp. NPDC004539 TaxID=3154280 RepID=UPI0033A202DD